MTSKMAGRAPALFVCGLGSSYLWRHVTGAVTASPAARPPARRRTGTRLLEAGKPGPRLAADQPMPLS